MPMLLDIHKIPDQKKNLNCIKWMTNACIAMADWQFWWWANCSVSMWLTLNEQSWSSVEHARMRVRLQHTLWHAIDSREDERKCYVISHSGGLISPDTQTVLLISANLANRIILSGVSECFSIFSLDLKCYIKKRCVYGSIASVLKSDIHGSLTVISANYFKLFYNNRKQWYIG